MKNTMLLFLFATSILNINGQDRFTGFFDLYGKNREQGIPNYITSDFVGLCYTLFFQRVVETLESEQIAPALLELSNGFIGVVTPDEANTREGSIAVGHFLLIHCLTRGEVPNHDLTNGYEAPSHLIKALRAEYELINNATGPAKSPLFHQIIDYSRYRVRGAYGESSSRGNFFKAMTAARTPVYFLSESKATGIDENTADMLTATARFISRKLATHPDLGCRMSSLVKTVETFFGPSDDLGVDDYLGFDRREEATASFRKRVLSNLVANQRLPSIIDAPIDLTALEEDEKPTIAVAGWRLLPTSRTVESAAFQKLVYPNVGTHNGGVKPFTQTIAEGKLVKGFPRIDELIAMLGSESAMDRLRREGDTSYEHYERAFTEARHELHRLDGLPGEHLRLIAEWLQTDDGETRLTSVKALWTRFRHVGILYNKTSTTGQAKSLTIPRTRDSAWLEPEPAFYRHLATMVRSIGEHTKHVDAPAFADILQRLADLASDLTMGLPQQAEDIDFLNRLDRILHPIVGGPDVPIVVDVHTDTNSGMVLEQAIGYPTAVKHEATSSRGARFSHHEFKREQGARLTDRTWQNTLTKGLTGN